MSERDRPTGTAGANTAARAATPLAARHTVPSSELFQGRREVVIEHNGETYSLRQTSKGGLILTK
jgi:hemin uptake protein HemP